MVHNPNTRNAIDSTVPVSRFNRGEAGRIFNEVNETGVRVVVKNNRPVCVLVSPERYDEMTEMLEDYALFFEAEERLKNAGRHGYLTQDQVIYDLGIRETDLDDGVVGVTVPGDA